MMKSDVLLSCLFVTWTESLLPGLRDLSWIHYFGAFLGAVLGFIVSQYALLILLRSHFLSVQSLVSCLKPQTWDSYHSQKDFGSQERATEEVVRIVKNGLGFWSRLWAWVRSNPLRLGLPGRKYLETVRLDLLPGSMWKRSRVRVISRRELEKLRSQPRARQQGILLAVVDGEGCCFQALTSEENRINRGLELTPSPRSTREDGELVDLRPNTELRPIHVFGQEPETGEPAGWRLR